MATPNTEEVNPSDAQEASTLNDLFGNYKAEWLRERIFDLFTTPAYFPQLEDRRPCVLMGGRGTGKTTVLKSLSYDGQFALSNRDISSIGNWPYYGFYYRVDTNRVTAFKGPDLSEDQWTRLFGHYLNLLLCGQVLRFLSWYSRHVPTSERLSAEDCQKVALSLNIEVSVENDKELLKRLENERIKFEAFINNLDENNRPPTSIQGGPIDELMRAVASLPQFEDKHFFFLIDEYENLLDPQQIVINTLIKHASHHHTFKIGVRELGWRKRNTLNDSEQLNSPADYVKINIGEKLGGRFEDFAQKILAQRLAQLPGAAAKGISVETIFPSLSDDQEAALLGVDERNRESLHLLDAPEMRERFDRILSPLQQYFVFFWCGADINAVREMLQEYSDDRAKWMIRYENYRHALLFTIRRGKVGIRKYYAGWETFVRLSGDNIRYLLELVDQTLLLHLEAGNRVHDPISFATQTMAAQNVGRKNVLELEGLSVHGAHLTRMVLGLGRIFQIMASEARGHAPEVNQFHLSESGELQPEVRQLLTAAVMHLALVRSTANKLSDEGSLKDYDYSLHPIFTPFFLYSHRRKRKMALAPDRLLGLVQHPTPTIRSILRGTDRDVASDLPEQLQLFESYYGNAVR